MAYFERDVDEAILVWLTTEPLCRPFRSGVILRFNRTLVLLTKAGGRRDGRRKGGTKPKLSKK